MTSGFGGACSTTTTATIESSTFDQADRLSTPGYTYDTLGRTFTDSAAATSTTNHYAGPGDNPSFSATGQSTWRNVTGPDGNLAAVISSNGATLLQLINLHSDVVATAADDPNATGVASYGESTEYGSPRSAANAPTTYGWLGGKQRSTNSLGGLTLMGVRLYNPATGRFASTDPVPGGNANAYTYPLAPMTELDLSGRMKWSWGWISGTLYLTRRETAMFAWGWASAAPLVNAVPYPWRAFVQTAFWYVSTVAGKALAQDRCLKFKSYGAVQTYKNSYCR